jgi:hypothetical protein
VPDLLDLKRHDRAESVDASLAATVHVQGDRCRSVRASERADARGRRQKVGSQAPNDLIKIQMNDNDKLTNAGRSLNNNWVPERIIANPDQRFSLTKATSFKLVKVDVGNITAVN